MQSPRACVSFFPLVNQSKRPQRIIAILKKCLVGSAARGDVLTCLVEMLTRSNRYPEVLQACQGILEIDPEFFPAVETIRSLQNNPAAKQALANVTVPATPSLSEEYDWLVASNVTEHVDRDHVKILWQRSVSIRRLRHWCKGLSARGVSWRRCGRKWSVCRTSRRSCSSNWRGRVTARVRQKKRWPHLRKFSTTASRIREARYNPFVKEAVVRAGEMLGRHYDTLGDVEKAISIYREVLSVDSEQPCRSPPDRATFTEWTAVPSGEICRNCHSKPDLICFGNIPPNQHIAALKAELFLKPEGA